MNHYNTIWMTDISTEEVTSYSFATVTGFVYRNDYGGALLDNDGYLYYGLILQTAPHKVVRVHLPTNTTLEYNFLKPVIRLAYMGDKKIAVLTSNTALFTDDLTIYDFNEDGSLAKIWDYQFDVELNSLSANGNCLI